MFKLNPEKEQEIVIEAANRMCVAARTAPKANGKDFIVTAIVSGPELKPLQDEMTRYGEENHFQYFQRDAENIDGKVVVLIGSKLKNPDESIDSYTTSAIDLGIAIGSAVSVASAMKVDNRVMFSIGKAALNIGLLGDDVKLAYGIPLSVSGKNPFFDRR
ncbi:ferredoxin domain-containing protein [Coprothermobacter platensis]|jgi:uncharacterized ferredoxin-like protein|uniref:ferredoxin domain-containing protein n=1 Tax=Coprothermobacter platensis TaxID=108819 RepID=UPI0003819F25|nr:DUF2148 domain-containing protein [Coprothermobacter platensis]